MTTIHDLEPLLWIAHRKPDRGGPLPIVAYPTATPGLVVHRPLGDSQEGDDFCVSHSPSGWSVIPYSLSLEDALEAERARLRAEYRRIREEAIERERQRAREMVGRVRSV